MGRSSYEHQSLKENEERNKSWKHNEKQKTAILTYNALRKV